MPQEPPWCTNTLILIHKIISLTYHWGDDYDGDGQGDGDGDGVWWLAAAVGIEFVDLVWTRWRPGGDQAGWAQVGPTPCLVSTWSTPGLHLDYKLDSHGSCWPSPPFFTMTLIVIIIVISTIICITTSRFKCMLWDSFVKDLTFKCIVWLGFIKCTCDFKNMLMNCIRMLHKD